MATFRVNKTSDYTVISNYHLKEKNMTLKAKGLLTLMLSLPENWDYSLIGLVQLCSENERAIKTAIQELKEFGYLKIDKIPPKKGSNKFDYIYNIYEKPLLESERQKINKKQDEPVQVVQVQNEPVQDEPVQDEPVQVVQVQNSTDKLNTNKLNTKESSTNKLNTNNTQGENEFSHACAEITDKWISTAIDFDLSGKHLKLNSDRKKKIKALLKTYKVEEIVQAIDTVYVSKFLQGKNKNTWKPTFDWIIKQANIIKVLEGNYDDKLETYQGEQQNNYAKKQGNDEFTGVTEEGLKEFLGGFLNDNTGV